MRTPFCLFVLSVLSVAAPRASAQMFSDTLSVAGNRTQVAAVFSNSDIDYEKGNDVERKILGVEAATNISGSIDGFAQFGIIADSEIDNFDNDGKGYNFGFGGRSIVHQDADYRVSAYGAFTYQVEEFDAGKVDIDLTTYDLHVGAVVGFPASPTITPYAGLGLVPLSDGNIKVKIAGFAAAKDDFERDDMLNLKVGGLFQLTSMTVRAELVLIGETTFTIAAGTML